MEERKLAFQHYRNDDYLNAIFYFSKILKSSSKASIAWEARGDCYRLLKRPAEAIPDLTKALSLNPKSAFALFARGEAYRQLGEYEKSIADLERYLELTPDNKLEPRDCLVIGFVYAELGRFPEGIGFFEKEIARYPNCAEAWVSLGRALFRSRDDFQRVMFCLETSVKLDDNDPKAWVYLAHAYYVAGEYEKAILAGTKAIKLDAKRYAAWMYRGQARLMLGNNPEQAIEDLVTAVRVAIEYGSEYVWQAWKVLGVARRTVGDPKTALDNLTVSIALNSNDDDAWVQRGIVHYQLGVGYYRDAVSDLKYALALNPYNQFAGAWLSSVERLVEAAVLESASLPPHAPSKTAEKLPSAPPAEVIFEPPPAYNPAWAKSYAESHSVAANKGFFAKVRNLFSGDSSGSRLPPPQSPRSGV